MKTARSLHQLRIGIDPLHPLVREMLVQKGGQRISILGPVGGGSAFCRFLPGAVRLPLRIPCQRQGGDGHIEDHEHNQAVAQNLPRPHRQLLNQPRQPGIDGLQPAHGGNAPEEAIQQIDAPAQVEGESAVVPKYGSEGKLREYAADILVYTSQQGACHENKAVAFIAVAVQEKSQQCAAQSPYDAERPVDHAAAAHEHPGGQEAEDSLRQIPQERPDEEQRRQLIEAAPFREHRVLRLGPLRFRPDVRRDVLRIDGGEGALHPLLHPGGEAVLQEPGGLLHALGELGQALRCDLHAQDRHGGGDEIRRQKPCGSPLHHQSHRPGDAPQQTAQHRVQEAHGGHGQQPPQQGIPEADIAAQIVLDFRIIPQFPAENLLHEHARGVFHHRGQQQSAQEEEEQIVRKLRQKHREHHSAEAVYGTVGAVHEATVHELPAVERGEAHLHAPAREGVDEKQPDQICQNVCHINPLPLCIFFRITYHSIPCRHRNGNPVKRHSRRGKTRFPIRGLYGTIRGLEDAGNATHGLTGQERQGRI